MKLTRSITKSVIVLSLLAATSSPVLAAQFVNVRDGDQSVAQLPIKDQTRVRVEGGAIQRVFGDIWDKDKNPEGRIAMTTDVAAGEIYIQPMPNAGARPIKLDIKTDRGTFALLLSPLDIPGDTIIMMPKGRARPKGTPDLGRSTAQVSANADAIRSESNERKSGSYVRNIKGWMLAMALGDAPKDIEVREIGQEIALWKEVHFQLDDLWMGKDYVGERYTLVNKSKERLVLDEREFYRRGVLAVTVQKHAIDPLGVTAVWVLRQREQGE